eukprot:TRINITY_DN84386_c0_g1_i1.p1 TRINITY_DN84386_c0_g1~~TRINITY_DN84386_c0_g1_i1.p1  ORF type:complete len:149 (-),score=19.05 TRINITY_DN84386_c0_g1_i1:69-515(-)
MVMDEWKRKYSNTKDWYGTAMKWFWENYDPEGYSLFFVKYDKVQGEGKVGYMTANLLNGFLQRCDKVRKHAFAVMSVVGEEDNFDIVGCFLFRGKDISNEMKEHPSYEFHKFDRVDINNPDHRKLVEDHWCSQTTVAGRNIESGKVFK